MLDGEKVLGVIGGQIKLGLFKSATMAMIVTNRRFVFVEITNDMVAAETEKIKKRSAEEKPGFFGRMAMAMNTNKELLADLGKGDPDEVFAGNPKNFVVPIESVVQGRVNNEMKYDCDGDFREFNMVVLLKTADKKYELTLQEATSQPGEILEQALGSRFKKGLFR
ncbi:MAG: hypothetical protein PHD35_02695 [Synergistaceae bacterium]|nr:hypothetical protein [Synergistaceae bacterium]